MYLYGVELTKWLDTNLQLMDKVQYYLSDGLCFECTALSMLLLKDCPTAKIIQGASWVRGERLRHAWVEFEIDGMEFVSDLSWTIPGISPKRTYVIEYPKREVHWVCDYEMFWGLIRSRELYECMQNPESSNVFDELSSYGLYSENEIGNFGFNTTVNHWLLSPCTDRPFVRNHQVMAKEVIEDFLSDNQLRSPKEETVRALWRKVNKMIIM